MRSKLFLSFLFCSTALLKAQEQPKELQVEKYQLKNGLTVYLNEDHSMPSVMGMVTVKGGSKRDPEDATGIAHYFEHIMFKGTQDLGTIDYNSEKVYLDSIQMMYDKLGETEDKKEREQIQLKINHLSIIAADYAIPNEVARVVNSMGGSQLNAFTSNECISYHNSFPASEMEKWLDLYAHRFEHPVFRLFQSELETVYEEKNMYADNMFQTFYEKFLKEMFPGTPYGDYPIIGTTEDLKNPSISKMKKYYDTYYVPNNMALILTGDFDKEMAKPLIEEKFGSWKAKELPTPEKIEMKPFKGRVQVNKRLLPIKVGVLGYKTVPEGHSDELAITVCNNLLSNYSGTGLLNELVNENKLMEVDVENESFEELGGDLVMIVPKLIGGSLKKSESLVLEKIEALKKGEFDDDLFHAVKLQMSIDNQQNIENAKWRCYDIMYSFLYNKSWDDVVNYTERLNALTKDDIVKVANRYFTDDYLAFYSRMGFPKKDKIKKPPYKPVSPKNTEAVSAYAQKLDSMKEEPVKPDFITEGKDFNKGLINDCIPFYCVNNPINDIFTVKLKFPTGTNQSKDSELASSVLNYCGADSVSYEDFKKQLQKIGADVWVNSSTTNFTISISGLEENLMETLNLVNGLVLHPNFKEKEKKKLVREYHMDKKMEAKDVDSESDALNQYVLFREKSSYLNAYTSKDIKNMPLDSMLSATKRILGKGVEIHYCGKLTAGDFKEDVSKALTFVNTLSPAGSYFMREKSEPDHDVVYFINDKNAIQSHINLYVIGQNNDTVDLTNNYVFNKYFSGDMSSIVFQEIREFRSLAYSAWGRSIMPFDHSQPRYFKGGMSTQSDKTVEALDAFVGLIKDMPEKDARLMLIKKTIKQSVNSNRPGFRNLSASIPDWKYIGCTSDPMEKIYNHVDSVQFSDIEEYYEKYIKGKHIIITIVGDKRRIDMKSLSKFGEVIELKKNKIFN